MRPIEFRAKTIKGEWVEGLICKPLFGPHKGGTFISNSAGSPLAYEVRPETLSQFTGLHDKNGEKIWEGDIVKFHHFLFDGDEHEEEGTCVITWGGYGWNASHIVHDGVGEYMGYSREDQLAGKAECYFMDFYGLHDESFEVIGNRFDNPELLQHNE